MNKSTMIAAVCATAVSINASAEEVDLNGETVELTAANTLTSQYGNKTIVNGTVNSSGETSGRLAAYAGVGVKNATVNLSGNYSPSANDFTLSVYEGGVVNLTGSTIDFGYRCGTNNLTLAGGRLTASTLSIGDWHGNSSWGAPYGVRSIFTLSDSAMLEVTSGDVRLGVASNQSSYKATGDYAIELSATDSTIKLDEGKLYVGNATQYYEDTCFTSMKVTLKNSDVYLRQLYVYQYPESQIVFDGATLHTVDGFDGNFIGRNASVDFNPYTIAEGGLTIDAGGDIEIKQDLQAAGPIVKKGEGKLTFSAAQSGAGSLTIEEGSVYLESAIGFAGTITVGAKGTLSTRDDARTASSARHLIGSLVFEAGATIEVDASTGGFDYLASDGTIVFPSEGKVNVVINQVTEMMKYFEYRFIFGNATVAADAIDHLALPDGYAAMVKDEKLYIFPCESGETYVSTAQAPVTVKTSSEIAAIKLIPGGTYTLGGGGAARVEAIDLKGGTITVDPPKVPIVVAGDIKVSNGKFALASDYASTACGRFTLATVKGDLRLYKYENSVFSYEAQAVGTDVTSIFDTSSVSGAAVVKVEAAAADGCKELVLYVGDYDSAPVLKLMPMGDSLTHRSSAFDASDVTTGANYRMYLCDMLAARGFRVKTVGFWNDAPARATGLAAPADYRRHTAFAGEQVITSATANGNAGLRESIDNILDKLADTPDVITLMIGTNDINNDYRSADPTPVVVAWSNIVAKICRRYPSTQIICASILEMPTDYAARNANSLVYNAALKSVIDGGAFSAAQVKWLDMRAVLPRTEEDYLGATNLHPSWYGHSKTAAAWADAIVEARLGTLPSGEAPAVNTASGAENNVPAEYRVDMIHLLTLRPTVAGKVPDGGAAFEVVYSNESVKASTRLSRVAYYLELKRSDKDERRYVWADMDAWDSTRTLGAMGFPLDKQSQCYAENLHVKSNMGAVHDIAPGTDGKRAIIQFTPTSINTNHCSKLIRGLDGWYDWNVSYINSSVWGLMNIDRVVDDGDLEDSHNGEVLFSYSGWNRAAASLPYNEIVIGNFALNGRVTGNNDTRRSLIGIHSGRDINCLTEVNAKAYDPDEGGDMRLEIWGVRPGVIVIFE